MVKDRIAKISDLENIAGFFWKPHKVDKAILGGNSDSHLTDALNIISNIDKWELEELNDKLMAKIKEKGYKIGDFFMDLRVALTGSKFTPPINDSIIILGKDKTINRLKSVL